MGADFDDALLSRIATAGGGHFYFIEHAKQIPDNLTSELGDALNIVARDAATPDSKSDSLLFRCCSGERNAASYPVEAERERFVEKTLSREKLVSMLQSIPALHDIAEVFRLSSAVSQRPSQ